MVLQRAFCLGSHCFYFACRFYFSGVPGEINPYFGSSPSSRRDEPQGRGGAAPGSATTPEPEVRPPPRFRRRRGLLPLLLIVGAARRAAARDVLLRRCALPRTARDKLVCRRGDKDYGETFVINMQGGAAAADGPPPLSSRCGGRVRKAGRDEHVAPAVIAPYGGR